MLFLETNYSLANSRKEGQLETAAKAMVSNNKAMDQKVIHFILQLL